MKIDNFVFSILNNEIHKLIQAATYFNTIVLVHDCPHPNIGMSFFLILFRIKSSCFKIGKKEKNDQLYKAILQLKDEQECYDFFQDLCTVSELRSMEQRFEVASLLDDGMIYNDILERTGASSATISRVNRSLSYGTGAYAKIFARIKKK